MTQASNAQLISSLYIAVYSRAPETSGFNFWLQQLDNGDSLENIANLFVIHPVFSQTYQDLSNQEVIERFYKNILGGAGDQAGIDYWVEHLDNNASIGAVLASFLTASLEIDLSTPNEWLAAQARQNTLINKAEVASYYAQTMGEASQLSGDSNSASIVTDPMYQQAAAVLTGINSESTTVITAKQKIDSLYSASDENFATGYLLESYFDDDPDVNEQVLTVNLNHSHTEKPTGEKQLWDFSMEGHTERFIVLLNGGVVNDEAHFDWIYIPTDVELDLRQANHVLLFSRTKGEGMVNFTTQKDHLDIEFDELMDGQSILNMQTSDNVKSLTFWAAGGNQGDFTDAKISLGTAKGLDIIEMGRIQKSTKMSLDLSKADVGDKVTVSVIAADTLHIIGSNQTRETIQIQNFNQKQLILENMNFKDSQDQIDLRLSHTNFSGLSLSQQGNDVLIQAPYNGNTSTIKIIGAQVADFDAADFIF